jgi:CRP-like cAMP-binding protein
MVPTGNHLLDGLSPSLRATILASAGPCNLQPGTVLVSSDAPARHLMFLTSGAASLVVKTPDRRTCEIGLLGRESIIGSSALFSTDMSHVECIMQISGIGLRVPAHILRTLFADSREFRATVLANVQRQIHVSAQLSGCNLLHRAESRFARWLLTASDLSQSSRL